MFFLGNEKIDHRPDSRNHWARTVRKLKKESGNVICPQMSVRLFKN